MQKLFGVLFGNTPPDTTHNPLGNPQYTPLLTVAQNALNRAAWDEAMSVYQQGLELARAESNLRAQQFFLSGLGTVFYKREEYVEAEVVLLDALAFAQRIDDPGLIARSQVNLGELYFVQKQLDRAKTYHEQALASARNSSNDKLSQILALEHLARVYMEQNNPSYASHLLKEAVMLAQDAQEARLGAGVVGLLGKAYLALGDRGTGRHMLEQAQRLAMQTGREHSALQWVVALANEDLSEGNYRAALERYQAAEDLSRRIGRQTKQFYQELALNLSVAYRHLGDYAQSQTQAERALLHSRELDDAGNIAQATLALGLAMQGRGQHAAAVEQLEFVLSQYESGVLDNPSGRAGVLLALGKSQQRIKHNAEAEVAFNEALALAREADSPQREAEALHLLGAVKNAQGQRKEAVEMWKQAIRLFESEGKSALAARALCDLGNLRRMMGDLSSATKDFEDALVSLSSVDDQVTRGLVLSNAANLYTQLGDVTTAEAHYEESIKIARTLRDVHSESVRLGNLAWLYVLTGRTSRALNLLEGALNLSRRLDDTLLVAIQTNNLAYALAKEGQTDKALTLYRVALDTVTELESERWVAIIGSNLAATLLDMGDYEEAERLLLGALEISTRLEDLEIMIRSRHRLGFLRVKQGRLPEAHELGQTAYEDARRMGYRKGQADAARTLGEAYTSQGDSENAKVYFGEAHRLYKLIQDPLAEMVSQKIA